MSSVLTELVGMSVKITPLPDRKKWHPGRTKSLQLYFQISNETLHRVIRHSTDGRQQQSPPISRPKSAYLWMDAALFGRQTEEELSGLFAPELGKIGIMSSWRRAEVVSKVREEVTGMMRSVEKRRKVMVISVEIETEVIHQVFRSGLERAAWESSRNGSRGMVAADMEAAKRMMKAVRIGEKEECVICLEEMEEMGMGLPCQHLFHSNCILRWLQTSHYCPLCRFQLPT